MSSWHDLRSQISRLVSSEDLERLADAYAAEGIDLRGCLLKLVQQYGADDKCGRALRAVCSFRSAEGAPLIISQEGIAGAVRFMYDGQREDTSDEVLEGLLRDILCVDNDAKAAIERANSMLAFVANADPDSIKGLVRFAVEMKRVERAGLLPEQLKDTTGAPPDRRVEPT